MTGDWLLQPRWVMVGGSAPDGSALLIASRKAYRADLHVEQQREQVWTVDGLSPLAVVLGDPLYRVSVDARDMVMIQGPDFLQTHEELLRRWSTPQ